MLAVALRRGFDLGGIERHEAGPGDAKPVAAFSALGRRKKPSGVEFFDDVERRDDARSPACPVGHERFLVESAIVENNGIRAEQIAEEMQGRHVRGVDAFVGLRPARPEHDLARGVSLLDRALECRR